MSQDLGGSIVWRPGQAEIDRANLTRFMQLHNIADFDTLIQRSTSDAAWFTSAILRFLNIYFDKPYTQVLDLQDGLPWPRWCVDGELNITATCLDQQPGDAIALRWESEAAERGQWSYAELQQRVCQAANALRSLGLQKGDAVGIYMPMIPEIVVSLLAIARIGGVILPLFSGYGASAVVTRMADVSAKALITADAQLRRGKIVPMLPVAEEAAALLPSLEHILVVPYLGQPVTKTGQHHAKLSLWTELVPHQSTAYPYERTAAEDALMIIYTSGTTGRPKGAVHTHCGFPVKAAQDMAFGTDVHAGDVVYWVTDMGWMMGPWLVFGSLILGATLVIYDGAPDYPDHGRLWELVEQHQINVLGISPTLIRSLIPHGTDAINAHNLSSLRAFASTGEPWNPDPWNWLFHEVGGGRLPIINYSGGTEISGGIVMGNPITPLKPTAFSAVCPGIAADVLDEHGQPVRGQVGELVIRAPWIGMTRGFWRDPQRYMDTYWSRWEDTWVHGDFAMLDEDGMWYILGRSDDTIKIAGKRLGPAEVESLMVEHPAVVEAAAIGVPHEIKGSELVVFCVLHPNHQPTDQLAGALRQLVINALGKPLAPKAIHFVADLPKTRNAKVMRRMIRAAYLGQDPGDTSSLVNPDSVHAIAQMIH